MARIAGVELQDGWRVDYALTRIKGIGWVLSNKVLEGLKIDPSKRVSKLSPEDISGIAGRLEEYPTEGELVRIVRSNVSRLKAIGAYRGIRHARNLPSRGQRTRTNARTNRGKRKTVGAFKKEALARTRGPKGQEGENK